MITLVTAGRVDVVDDVEVVVDFMVDVVGFTTGLDFNVVVGGLTCSLIR